MIKKIWFVGLGAILFIAFASVSDVSAQKTKKPDPSKQKKQTFILKATKAAVTRGADANIKDNSLLNAENVQFPAPVEKGGANTRGGGVCKVVFDNRTTWKIQIYVDGSFRGMMAPFGDSVAFTGAGATRVYARADFDNGTILTWGPTDYMCYPGQYIYFRMDG